MRLSAPIQKNQLGREPFIARLAESSSPPASTLAVLLRANGLAEEYPIPSELSYLLAGDIVRVNELAGEMRVLYRRNSRHNVLFFTDRCNSRCLMCSQPPRVVDDGYLVDDILEAIPLMSPDTQELCITGGEPTLLGPKLLDVIRSVKRYLPRTALHMLTNGRLFTETTLARDLAAIDHPNFMLGIPLYSDIASRHDFVVQARGAFDETVRGIMKLKQANHKIEIRFVIHKQTVDRLPHTARFIARNIPFVDQVALMGLEMMGFTKSNLDALWIDPFDYQPALAEAVRELDLSHINVLIYNHQLCVLDKRVWPFARRSISDWKNIYMPECNDCGVRENCGGFFASAILRHSRHIKRLNATPGRELAAVCKTPDS
jgi:His-Xaa-Ser system radical SAM maturase HxsC